VGVNYGKQISRMNLENVKISTKSKASGNPLTK
jgi:hypothetical protein